MDRTRKIAVTIWVLLGLVVLTALDALFGGLRLVSSRANQVIDFAVCGLPLVCVILLTHLPRSRMRLLGFVGLIPIAIFCALGGIGDAIGETAFSAIVIRQSSIRVGYSQVVTYYSDVGIMDDGEVFVQQEITLLPGLIWVKPVFEPDDTLDVKVKALDRHHIECDYVVYSDAVKNPVAAAKRDVAWVF